MKSRFFSQGQKARILDAIRSNGSINQDQATQIGIRRLAARVLDLRRDGWGLTAFNVSTPTGTVVAYRFTERQQVNPALPVYPSAAPAHSRYRH